jgi:hypothetical protein
VRHFPQLLFVLILGHAAGASAGLIDRGGGLIYDDVLNITWTQNASLCVTLDNCVNRDDALVTGGMIWADANTWAANLVYQGFDDWRLPYASVAAGAGPTGLLPFGFPCTGAGGADEAACRDNEMAYMFYYNLEGNPGDDKTGSRTSIDGIDFTDIQSIYWSGTDVFGVPDDEFRQWFFHFNDGTQNAFGSDRPLAAWAVRPGDVVVGAVPEPNGLPLALGTLLLVWAGRTWRRSRVDCRG